MKAQTGRKYAQVLNGRCHWIFTQDDLPEWEDSTFQAIDVTGDEVSIGDIWDGKIFHPDPGPTPEQLAAQARADRDAKLSATNWLVERHREEQETGATTLTAQEYADLLAYRQALRDVPQQAGFPESIAWPELPDDI